MIKKRLKPRLKTQLLLLTIFMFSFNGFSQITVNSLEELLPYLKQDNVDVKLTPGDYSINAFDITNGTFSNPLFLFEGSDSTYDFTDVKININTLVFTKFGSVDVNEIQILGNNNVLKNLTIEDIGTTAPSKRAQAIVMDGRDNRIEGFHLTVRGSYPYGYGDAFGKGGGAVIAHRKHSGILIRGLRNHLKNSTIISRSYGHIVFMQAASYPIIEGCYIEGEMRTTDDMLAETSGPAFDVDFMTTWGYKLPSGFIMSLQEAGIRAYNAGTTYIDGVEIQRGTDNPTVLNCTMKNARTGVTISHATGTKYIEGCTAIGCENGFSIGTGIIVNCAADAAYGPVFRTVDDNEMVDITVLPPSAPYYNGHNILAFIGGDNHDITFRSGITDIPSNLKIMVAGENNTYRSISGSASNNFIRNLTNFPVVFDSQSSNNTLRECDINDIVDNGTNNTLISVDCDSDNLAITAAAIQSSTAYVGLANKAIDGSTDGYFGGGSVTHTDPSSDNAWWQVNLNGENSIGLIKVFNRIGKQSYIDRLANFSVHVYDENGSETFSQVFTNNPPNPSLEIDAGGAKGKIIKIVQLGDGLALSLAEVQIFASSLSNNDKELDNSISIFPNPTSGTLTISSTTSSGVNFNETNILVYDVNGRKVTQLTPKNILEAKLNLSHLQSGVYFVKVSDKSRNILKKVVKL